MRAAVSRDSSSLTAVSGRWASDGQFASAGGRCGALVHGRHIGHRHTVGHPHDAGACIEKRPSSPLPSSLITATGLIIFLRCALAVIDNTTQLPHNAQYPYGHGKFETMGSLPSSGLARHDRASFSCVVELGDLSVCVSGWVRLVQARFWWLSRWSPREWASAATPWTLS